ncbi:hypothetical protein RDI58_004019 [Solanum bulbocastanum]|uniref:Uncharacterized protein n=1 Tax=Solanum bulbocastanum TaxID=147425 RepID=A0AAN8YPJ1_SOLBU
MIRLLMLSSSPTKPLSWWEDSNILGGRDEVAGGTWLACTRSGRLSFLTNVREINSNSHTKSRGDLPLRFLKSVKSPHDFSEQLLKEAGEYNGFNLIVADLCSMTMLYITNRPKHTGMSVIEVSPGIHVLSNATLDSPWPKDVPVLLMLAWVTRPQNYYQWKWLDLALSLEPQIQWPQQVPEHPDSTLASPDSVTVPLAGTDLDTEEVFAVTACGTLDPCGTRERFPVVVEGVEVSLVRLSSAGHASEAPLSSQRLEYSFKQLLDEYGEYEIPIGQAAERIMRDLAKEDSNLPGIYSPECEYQLSSIFVDTEMAMGRFGTRSTSSLAVRSSGDATFYEVYLEKDVWKEHQMTFDLLAKSSMDDAMVLLIKRYHISVYLLALE